MVEYLSREETAFKYLNSLVKPRPPNNREEFIYEVFLPKLLEKLGESDKLAEVISKIRSDDAARLYAEEIRETSFFDPLFNQIILKDEHKKSVRAISEEVTHSLTATPLIGNTLKYLTLRPLYAAAGYAACRSEHFCKLFYKTDDMDNVKEIIEAEKKLYGNHWDLAKMTLKSFSNKKMPQKMIRNISDRLGVSRNDAHSILGEYFGRVGYLMGGNALEEIKKVNSPKYADALDYFYSEYLKEEPATPFSQIKKIKRKMRDIRAIYQERTNEVHDAESKLNKRVEFIKSELSEKYRGILPDELNELIKKAVNDDEEYNNYYGLLKEKTKKYNSFDEHRKIIIEESLTAYDLERDARWLEININEDLGHGIGYLTAYRAFSKHGEDSFNMNEEELIGLMEDTYKRAKKAQILINEKTIPKVREEINSILPLAKNLQNMFGEFGIKYRVLATSDLKEEHIEKIKGAIYQGFYSKSAM